MKTCDVCNIDYYCFFFYWIHSSPFKVNDFYLDTEWLEWSKCLKSLLQMAFFFLLCYAYSMKNLVLEISPLISYQIILVLWSSLPHPTFPWRIKSKVCTGHHFTLFSLTFSPKKLCNLPLIYWLIFSFQRMQNWALQVYLTFGPLLQNFLSILDILWTPTHVTNIVRIERADKKIKHLIQKLTLLLNLSIKPMLHEWLVLPCNKSLTLHSMRC